MSTKKPRPPRVKWHNEEQLDHVLESLKDKARLRMIKSAKMKDSKNKLSVHVVRDCDLRASLPEKALSVHQLARWTAFINKAGTLSHILPKEGDGLVRVATYFSLKRCSDKHVEHYVQSWAEGRLL